MKQDNGKNEENYGLSVSNIVDLFAGSAVSRIAAVTRLLLRKNTGDTNLHVQYVLFDFKTGGQANEMALIAAGEVDDLFAPGEHVAAVLQNDPEFLARAEREGLLRSLPDDWIRNPGASLDNTGASGDPRVGRTLAIVNEHFLTKKLQQAIQNAFAHDRQARLVLRGEGVESRSTRVAVRFHFSAAGATGNGTLYWFLNKGARISSENSGVSTKVVLDGIIRANLATHDNVNADLNELALLKQLRALASGQYVDPETGQVIPCPYHLLFLESSQNCHGTMTTLDELLCHEGRSDFIFWHTAAGRIIRERLSDIESWEFDEYGDPRQVFTRSCAGISRSQKRLEDYCCNQGGALFAESLLAEGNTVDICKQAAGLARLYRIVESDQDNQITADMLKPNEFDGENIPDRTRASFTDRLEGTRGLQRAAAAADAIDDMRNNDIGETFEPLMQKQARIKLDAVKEKLSALSDQCMRKLSGLWESRQILAFLKLGAESSLQAVVSKINNLQELVQPHEEILAEATEQLQQFEERGWLYRVYNRLLIGRVAVSFEESGQAALNCDLQIAACTIAVEDFLTPLLEYLDCKLAWLSDWGQKLQLLSQSFRQKAENVEQESTSLSSLPGFELTTSEYLLHQFSQYLNRLGDKEGFASESLSRFLTKNDSLAGLPEAPIAECEELFTSACDELFRPMIGNTDVVSEFKRLYPDNNTQEKIFEQLILQSEGRLSTTGEVNHQVPWLKVVSVPRLEHAEWARQLCEKVDKKAGKWEVAVHSNPDTIAVMQLRGSISLTPFIKRIEPSDNPEQWTKIVSHAPEPASALMVGPNPTARQFRRVLAKAIAADLLTEDDGSFALKCPYGKTLALGSDYESVEHKLHPQWRLLAFIESTFGRDIVITEERVTARLEDLQQKLKSADASDKRLCLVDLTAVREALIQVGLIAPWASRIRQANHRRLSE
jgi:hypothetical protein